MRRESTSSMIAWILSQSATARWTVASDRRLRSRRGGKRPARLAPRRPLRTVSPFEPDQKAEGQHHRHGVAVEGVPAPPLELIPSEQAFRFLVKLLDPVSAVRVLDHRLQRGLGREGRPEVLAVPGFATSGPLANEP